MSSEVVSRADRTKLIISVRRKLRKIVQRKGALGGFDGQQNKADITGGYRSADCVWSRSRLGRRIGTSEEDSPRVQAGSEIYCADGARLSARSAGTGLQLGGKGGSEWGESGLVLTGARLRQGCPQMVIGSTSSSVIQS